MACAQNLKVVIIFWVNRWKLCWVFNYCTKFQTIWFSLSPLKCLWNGWNFFLKLCWFYSLKYAEYHAVFYFCPAFFKVDFLSYKVCHYDLCLSHLTARSNWWCDVTGCTHTFIPKVNLSICYGRDSKQPSEREISSKVLCCRRTWKSQLQKQFENGRNFDASLP
jgi:hypothetical protein